MSFINKLVQIVVPGTSAGLVSSAGLPGVTAGTAVAASYVGEVITTAVAGAIQSSVADTYVDGQTFTLQPGVWRIDGTFPMECQSASSVNNVTGIAAIRQGSTVVCSGMARFFAMSSSTNSLYLTQVNTVGFVNISIATTYKVSVLCNGAVANFFALIRADASVATGSNGIHFSKVYATRIA